MRLPIGVGQGSLPVRLGRPLFSHLAAFLFGRMDGITRQLHLVFREHDAILVSWARTSAPFVPGSGVNATTISEVQTTTVTLSGGLLTVFLLHWVLAMGSPRWGFR